MLLVNYRAVQDRFTHIDAEFVHCHMEAPGKSSYAVRFYPWWEHPFYHAAVDAGHPWGFTPRSAEGKITVTIYPCGLRAFSVSKRAKHSEIIDCAFLETHPLLWHYEDDAPVTCNSSLTTEQVLALVDLVRTEAGAWVDPFQFLNFAGGFPQFLRWAAQGSFHLGTFPRPLYEKVQAYLQSIGARTYGGNAVFAPSDVPKIVLLDGDYIIADDFDVDVPEIIHKPEWFSPVPG